MMIVKASLSSSEVTLEDRAAGERDCDCGRASILLHLIPNLRCCPRCLWSLSLLCSNHTVFVLIDQANYREQFFFI